MVSSAAATPGLRVGFRSDHTATAGGAWAVALPSEQPAGVEELPVPPAVVPPTGRSYAQALTSSPLDGADWVYVAKGEHMADKYSGPYKVLERGNKAWKLHVGERVDVVSRDCLKPHLGSMAPEVVCHPQLGGRGRPLLLLLRQRSQGACVTDELK